MPAAASELDALVKARKVWLFKHLPARVAEYQYDVFRKTSQKRLARRLGLSVAETYAGPKPLAEIIDYLRTTAPDRFVVKPDLGSSARGFRALVREGDAYREIKTGRRRSLHLLEAALERQYTGRRDRDGWLVEELLVPPDGSDRDVDGYKFFCFEGVAELVSQNAAGPGPKERFRNFYDRDWSPVAVIANPKRKQSAPVAPVRGPELLAAAEGAAAHLCYPLVRVDLYNTHRGVVFGEFTPGPGSLSRLNEAAAVRLLTRWYEAEASLRGRLRSGAFVPMGPEDAPATDFEARVPEPVSVPAL